MFRFLTFFCWVFAIASFAQEPVTGVIRSKPVEGKQKVFVTAGPEISFTLPTHFGSDNTAFAGDTLFRMDPVLRFRFGCALRFDFSKNFSFQTGLYYISRQHRVRVGPANVNQQDFSSVIFENTINYIGYEIPLMFLAYARLGEKTFLNNSVGVSLDFFPSSAQRLDQEKEFKLFMGRNSWMVPALKASVGFEYRTDNYGYLYLGGNFHQPFFSLADLFIERNNTQEFGLQAQRIAVPGTYFSIDFKYFLPPGKKNKWIN
jgi:hypothetical protein